MKMNNENTKSELQIRFENEAPNFYSEYKETILGIVDMKSDFYVSNIGGFMLQTFNNEIKGLDLSSKEIKKEIESIKIIIFDIGLDRYQNLYLY